MHWDAAREAAIWELEEQHLKDKAHLAQRQLKDLHFLKRHQMITRHEKVSVRSGPEESFECLHWPLVCYILTAVI